MTSSFPVYWRDLYIQVRREIEWVDKAYLHFYYLGRKSLEICLHLKMKYTKIDGLSASEGLVNLNVSKESNWVMATFSLVTYKHKYLKVYSLA